MADKTSGEDLFHFRNMELVRGAISARKEFGLEYYAVQRMSLITATTDFLRTLSAVPGNWGKLRYLAGLRKRDGSYHHWGLERTHGAEAAYVAIDEAHGSVMTEMLRSPLRELVEDAELSSQEFGADPQTFMQQVQADFPQHLPNSPAPVIDKHFSSAIRAVKALLRSRVGPGSRPAS